MNNIEHLIKNLELLDKQIPSIKDDKFLNFYFPYTIEETIKKLETLEKITKENQKYNQEYVYKN